MHSIKKMIRKAHGEKERGKNIPSCAAGNVVVLRAHRPATVSVGKNYSFFYKVDSTTKDGQATALIFLYALADTFARLHQQRQQERGGSVLGSFSAAPNISTISFRGDGLSLVVWAERHADRISTVLDRPTGYGTLCFYLLSVRVCFCFQGEEDR